MKRRQLTFRFFHSACLRPIVFVATVSSHLCGMPSNITAIWANDGGDKVTQDELRVTKHTENQTGLTKNRTWDGKKISIFGAHNEIVSFNAVLEAGSRNPASNVTVSFDKLLGPNGSVIQSAPTIANGVFDWTNRQIEIFYTRYLSIHGLSYFGYNKWDERQIPLRMQRPHLDDGTPYGDGGWYDRPDHDKLYPDPLVPIEAVGKFDIAAGQNQSIWVDIYIPKEVPAGIYNGLLSISEEGESTHSIPVSLSVYNFALPDQPSAKTIAALSGKDIMDRYISGGEYRNWNSPDGVRAARITDRYYQLFHRHKVALIGENECPIADHPCDSSLDRLSGALYTEGRGYDGPGVQVPNGVFSIGTYGTWGWQADDERAMWRHADAWVSWFKQYLPGTEYFLYLQDEPRAEDFPKNEMWAKWISDNPGPGKSLLSAITKTPVIAQTEMPHVNIPIVPADTGACPHGYYICDNTSVGKATAFTYKSTPAYRYWAYNDGRPATGSSMTEDDGIAMRVLPWTQTKMGIQRWFYWYVNPDGPTDLFEDAVTFGHALYRDYSTGMAGGDGMSNGNGLLVYPGTDVSHPQNSYDLEGPIASLRLKQWRRGLQDADYINLANRFDSEHVQAIVERLLPKTLHEITAPEPSYYTGGGPSWSSDPDMWETARAELAGIIASRCATDASLTGCSEVISDGDHSGNASAEELPLTVSSSTPGASFVVFGSGCPSGFHTAPSTVQVRPGALCMISMGAPDGFTFFNWSDHSSSNPRWIVMSPQIRTVIANFRISDPLKIPVTITGAVPNSSVNVSGTSCPVGGPFALPVTWALAPGTECTLSATVPPGYRFKQWSDGSNGNPLKIVVSASALSLNVTYEQIISATPSVPSITIMSSPEGASFLSFGRGCSIGLYMAPSTIRTEAASVCLITMVPPDGMSFSSWSDGDTSNPRAILINTLPVAYVAYFK